MVKKTTNWEFKIVGLYRSDYRAGLHVRAMAKLLETSHVTLLPHLRRLKKKKILKFRMVGKNKEYLLNFGNAMAKEYLVVAEKLETMEFLNKQFLIKKINEQLPPLSGSLILFGSWAKSYATKASDVDLFYLGKIGERQIKEVKKIGKIYGKEINIKKVGIESFEKGLRTGDTLVKEVVKGHIVLKNADLFVDLLWRFYGG